MSSTQKDKKTTNSVHSTSIHRNDAETSDNDLRKKADSENQGHLSGSQYTIMETPITYTNPIIRTKK